MGDEDAIIFEEEDRHEIADSTPDTVENEYMAEVVIGADLHNEVTLTPAGVETFQWGLYGMDCPDCALTATRAVNKLKGIETCQISVTDGMMKMSVNLEKNTVADVNDILDNLGHAPKKEWWVIEGQRASVFSQRLGSDQNGLIKQLRSALGVLDVDLSKSDEIRFRWAAPISKPKSTPSGCISDVFGTELVVQEIKHQILRPDQMRLVGAIIALPVLALILVVNQFFPSILEKGGLGAGIIIFIVFSGTLAAGWRTFIEGWHSFRSAQFSIPVLTSLAIIGALFLQAWVEALLVAILVGFAGSLEGLAIERARKTMKGGFERNPTMARPHNTANNNKHDGEADSHKKDPKGLDRTNISANSHNNHDSSMIPVALVKKGDHIEVRSSEMVPVDGVIIGGKGSLDRSPLTGEPLPVAVKKGDEVLAGLILATGPVIVKTEKTGRDTRLSELIKKVGEERTKPPRIHGALEWFTTIWIPLVIILGPLVALLQGNIEKMLLIWIVACPCALLLAAPIPHAAALASAGKRGMVLRGGVTLERCAKIDRIILDKTGTLTEGTPSIAEIHCARGYDETKVLELAAGMEKVSKHAYAIAILKAAESQNIDAKIFEDVSEGEDEVRAKFNGHRWRLGRLRVDEEKAPTWLRKSIDSSREQGRGMVTLSRNDRPIALLSFEHDDLREGMADMIHRFTELGISVEILSGDDKEATKMLGSRLGLPPTACLGGLTPEEKAEYVRKCSIQEVVMMAGDGFNDSVSLAAADVGIAIGTGDSVSIEAADVLIPKRNPEVIPELIELAQRTRRTVMVNLFITVLVTIILASIVLNPNIEGIPLAVGFLTHEIAVIFTIIYGVTPVNKGARWEAMKGLWNDLIGEIKEVFTLLLRINVDEEAPTRRAAPSSTQT